MTPEPYMLPQEQTPDNIHCFRCPVAIDSKQCVYNCATQNGNRIQGFQCKRQRYEHNREMNNMTQDNTTPNMEAQQATDRLIKTNTSIVRHDFDPAFYTDNQLIMMVIRN